ncbi:MAG: M23 family metallopeptidase [Aminipila sp.]
MALSYIFPVSGRYIITSPFGSRRKPKAGASKNHQGIDIGVPIGTTVRSASSGKIAKISYNSARGNYIVVDHGSGNTTIYEHLSKTFGKVGDIVKQGEEIAKSGSTGISTGPHLHFEIRHKGIAVNPMVANLKSGGAKEIEKHFSLSSLSTSIDKDSMLGFVKENWWLIAGGLVLVAILK